LTDPRPLVVIVSGAPATGKTTLADRLGPALGLPVLHRDSFKEVLFKTFEANSIEESQRLGAASFHLMHATLGWLLDAGVSAVYESNFQRGLSEPELREHLSRCRGVLLHLETSRENVVARYEARALRGDRHPGHLDLRRIERHRANAGTYDWSRYEPLDLDVPILRIDTTDGYRPDLDEIVAFARTAAAVAPA
jgi:predicted kinase